MSAPVGKHEDEDPDDPLYRPLEFKLSPRESDASSESEVDSLIMAMPIVIPPVAKDVSNEALDALVASHSASRLDSSTEALMRELCEIQAGGGADVKVDNDGQRHVNQYRVVQAHVAYFLFRSLFRYHQGEKMPQRIIKQRMEHQSAMWIEMEKREANAEGIKDPSPTLLEQLTISMGRHRTTLINARVAVTLAYKTLQ